MNTKILFLPCIFFLLIACENSLKEVAEVTDQFKTAVETIKKANIVYSEQANVRVELEAPLLLRHKTKKPYIEFPKGLQVTFYDEELQISSTLTADHAIRYEKEQRTVLTNNVVWENIQKKEKLETEELVWNEHKQKIASEKFVKISTPTEIVFGEGFTANQDFSRYQIKKLKGTIQVDENEFQD